jgi:hypothetical protein
MSVALPRTIATSAGEGSDPSTMIRAVLIDPTPDGSTVVVSHVDLPTLPANPPAYGTQLAPDGVVSLIGKRVAQHRLHGGEVLLVGDGDSPAWFIAGCGPHRGRGILLQYERIADAYADTLTTLEQVGALLTFDEEPADEDEESDNADAA